MWGIAQANHMPLSQLESLNPQIADPSRIFPGQQVNLGTGGATASTSSSSGATATESSVVFPKTSSYQSASSGSQVTEAASTRLSGWAGGTGAMPADPARGVIEAVSKPDTDPLKIKDNKPRTV
jgi:LysM repeat protein